MGPEIRPAVAYLALGPYAVTEIVEEQHDVLTVTAHASAGSSPTAETTYPAAARSTKNALTRKDFVFFFLTSHPPLPYLP
jgi:hypothetical protein